MKVTGNVKYIPAGTTQYIVDGSDGEINVDTSLSAITIILPNIINSGYTNSDKGFIINDISGNAATNNITITAINNTVNSQSSILISSNGGTAKCSIASMNEWFAVTEPSTGGMSGNLTPNYIPKAATSSTLNNSIIYQNGTRIGIGTINPLTNLHVSGTNSSAIITSSRYSDDDNPGGFAAVKARGTEAFPSGVLFGDSIMTVGGFGYHSGGAIGQAVGKMVYYAKEDFTASANGTAFKLSTTPIGAIVDVFNFGISENGDVSIGDINLSPSARLHVTGKSATSSDYALKVDNSNGVAGPLLYVRNDGAVSIGTTTALSIFTVASPFNNISGFVSFLSAGDIFVDAISQSGYVLKVNTVVKASFSTNSTNASIIVPSGGLSIGTTSFVSSAMAHVLGDATSSNYALKVDNSAGVSLLSVRNDGNIYIGSLLGSYKLNMVTDVSNMALFETNQSVGSVVLNAVSNPSYKLLLNSIYAAEFGVNVTGTYIDKNGTLTLGSTASGGQWTRFVGSDTDIYIGQSAFSKFGYSSGSCSFIEQDANTPLGIGTISNQDVFVFTNNTIKFTVKNDGKVGIGTASPATSALLDLTSTTGSLLVPRMTTTQKNALTPANGMIVYDSTLDKFQGYEAGAWANLI